MFRIAMMPMSEKNQITLFAKTDEWLRFIEYLERNQNGGIARVIEKLLDRGEPTNRLRLNDTQARKLLREAGLSV